MPTLTANGNKGVVINAAGNALAAASAFSVSGTTLIPSALLDMSGASSGQIKFPAAQNASSNVNTLDDYEEGTFTVSDGSGAGLTLTNTTGTYVKVGKLVYVQMDPIYPATADGTAAVIGGLPFTSGSAVFSLSVGFTGGSVETKVLVLSGGTTAKFYKTGGGNTINSDLSAKEIAISGCYIASA